jgi:TonB-linked SusC/RagA family outer membrane protein
VGFAPQEVAINNRTSINITLAGTSQQLEQVVVVGYGTANRRDLTGSINTVKGREVADKPSSNPISSIQGKVPGVYIVNSGRPGAQPDVRIRGTNSINSVGPLYVVDGIFNDNINYINPADIESMEILKDPSSLAIFGVRGANGVIIITTKRARAGQVLVNFTSSVGIKRVVDKIELTDAAGFKMLYDEQLQNQARDAGRTYVPYNYTNWQGNTDWQDLIFQDAVLNYNNVSITGATEKNRFYMGLGYITEEGVIKHEKLKKFTLNINDELQVSKALKFGFNFNGYRARLPQERNVDAAVLAAPIVTPFNEQTGLYSTLPDFQRAQVFSPFVDIELRKNTAVNFEYRAVGSIFGEVNFLKNLTFRAAFFGDYGFNTGRSYSPIITVYNPEIVNAAPIDSLVKSTSVGQSQNIFTKIQQDYLLTYKNRFGPHNLTLLGGVTSYYRSFEGVNSSRLQGSGFPIPNNPRFWYTEIGDASTQQGSGSAYESATLSYLFRALYNYKNKYLLNTSFRRDGSSAFPDNGGRWQNFGAIGGAWVVSSEDFMDAVTWVDNLKVKASWGILGNQNTGNNYPYFPVLTSANSGVFGNNIVSALTPSYLPDSNLHWETVHSYEAGLELNTLRNKLHFEANYYNKLTKGVLVTIPGIAGTTPGLSNLGEVQNNGIELLATWNNSISKDFSYSFSANFTTINNEVKALSTTGYEIVQDPSRTKAGLPIGFFYGYVANGIYQTAEEIKQSPVSNIGAVKPGDIKYKDVNGDGFITTEDRTMIGNPTPDFTYGASININYKGFDFNTDVMGVYGNEIFRNRSRGTFAQFNYPSFRLDRWNGVGTSNWEPILSTGRANNYLISSYYIEDGSFFRIRNMQLGYNFSPAMLSSMRVKSLRVYVNAQNLKTFKNSTGYTSEFGGSATSFGVDNGSYPLPAIYTFGINLNF